MRILLKMAFVPVFLFAISTTLVGQEYDIQNLTNSLNLPFGSGISLNDTDQIATLVAIGNSDEVVIIDRHGNFTNITEGHFNRPGQGSINNLGQVIFTTDIEPPDDCSVINCDVILSNGKSFQNITNGRISVYPAGVLGRALNNSGDVAIGARNGLVLYNGSDLINLTSTTTITDTGNQPPSINAYGQIAFVGIDLTIGQNNTYLFDGSSIINLGADPALRIGGSGAPPSINDSGHVAFGGEVMGLPGGHLFFYDGTRTIDITAKFPQFEGGSILAVSLNNNDQIAFITASPFSSQDPMELWVLHLKTQALKHIDSGVELPTVQINNRSNIGYIKDQDIMLATPIPLTVGIDIRPKSEANRVNPNSSKNINVAILSAYGFDATTVDTSTIRFGATGTEAAPIHVAGRDVNGDGQRDLVVRFQIEDMGIQCGNTSATLTGQIASGQSILGTSPITTTGCKKITTNANSK